MNIVSSMAAGRKQALASGTGWIAVRDPSLHALDLFEITRSVRANGIPLIRGLWPGAARHLLE